MNIPTKRRSDREASLKENREASLKENRQASLRENRKHTPKANRAGLYKRAIRDAFSKLDPRIAVRNPVMFLVWVGTLGTALAIAQWFNYFDFVFHGSLC